MRSPLLMVLSIVAVALGSACRAGSPEPPPPSDLERGGVYVAYNLGCDEGCDELARGDVILAVDGHRVDSRAELLSARLTEARPVALDVVRPGESAPRRVTIRARPGEDLPPLQGTPPFWTVSAEALDRAPEWARSPMFSHALPAFGFVHVDGGWLNGRDLYGKKAMIVVWPDLPLFERQYNGFRDQMATFYGVLQKAQDDLEAEGVDLVFAVCGGSNDTTVRRELEKMGQRDREGQPMRPLPVYRCPSLQSGLRQVQGYVGSPARYLGLEHSAQRFFHYVRGFPVVVVVDEGGIVRWHSSGYHEGPQRTILAAVEFAMRDLDEAPAPVGVATAAGPSAQPARH